MCLSKRLLRKYWLSGALHSAGEWSVQLAAIHSPHAAQKDDSHGASGCTFKGATVPIIVCNKPALQGAQWNVKYRFTHPQRRAVSKLQLDTITVWRRRSKYG